MKKKRHYKVILTPEAIALREIRERANLSIREVCRRLGKSESFLRHIETGRSDLPSKEMILKLFEMYAVTYKMFRHKVSDVREQQLSLTPREEIRKIIDSISDEKLPLVRSMLAGLIQ